MKKKTRAYFFLAVLVISLFTVCGKTLAAADPGKELSGTTLMYALDKVNVRSGPGTDADIIGELEQGETIFAVELTEEGWYRVVFEGEKGYIRQDFLEIYGTQGDWTARDLSEYEALYNAEAEAAAEPVETEPAAEAEPEAEPQEPEGASQKPGKNIAPVIVLTVVLAVIILYSGIQIAAERRHSGQEDEGEAEETDGGSPGEEDPDGEQVLSEADLKEEISGETPGGDDFLWEAAGDCDPGDSYPEDFGTEEEADILELAWEAEEEEKEGKQ